MESKLIKVPGLTWNGEQVFKRADGREVVVRGSVQVVVSTNPERDERTRLASLQKREEREARAMRVQNVRFPQGSVFGRQVNIPPPMGEITWQDVIAIFREANPGRFNLQAAMAAPKTEQCHVVNIGAGTANGPSGSKTKATTNHKKAEKHRRRFEQRGKRMKNKKKKKR